MVDIFAELGRRLTAFGSDGRTREMARVAQLQNPWFTPREVARAARSLAGRMLSPEALADWLTHYPALPVAVPRDVLVVMAGNIPFVGFQDLLCVVASGHRALVKTSSKDSFLMSWLIDELRGITPELPVSEAGSNESPDAVIAMGGDNAVRSLGALYPGVPALLRGNRSSLAVISGNETTGQLDGLADDILSYSGLGCRNVSLVFVPDGYDTGELENALRNYRAGVNPKYLNNCRQVKATLSMNAASFIDCGHCVMCEEREFPASVSRINYTRYSSADEVSEWIADRDAGIQCVAGSIAHPRAVGFGETQSPTLRDYPDGRDTMRFLMSI